MLKLQYTCTTVWNWDTVLFLKIKALLQRCENEPAAGFLCCRFTRLHYFFFSRRWNGDERIFHSVFSDTIRWCAMRKTPLLFSILMASFWNATCPCWKEVTLTELLKKILKSRCLNSVFCHRFVSKSLNASTWITAGVQLSGSSLILDVFCAIFNVLETNVLWCWFSLLFCV